jgi:NADPH-dependent 2,4-dienoyl-CoA reductase/sulfur reductase-like enzyme
VRVSLLAADEAVPITFDGREIAARRGETLAAALAAAGVKAFRTTRLGAPRGLFCGMGVCQDCLVEVDGGPNRRACMIKVDGPLEVRMQAFPPRPAAWVGGTVAEERARDVDVLVVGGGAGGLTAAAVAAEAGARVVLVDERPAPGGQYYKQPLDGALDDAQFAGGARLIIRARDAGVELVRGTVWGAFRPPLEVLLDTGVAIRPRRLIVATGAFERAVPFPGWTLPGVMTTGAAQTLLRSYRVLAGRRILIAGNGPLNLQVAVELRRAGAEVVAVAEASREPGPRSAGALWRMASSAPGLVVRGARYLRELRRAGVPVLYGRVLRSVEEVPGGGLRADLGDGLAFEAGVVAVGNGFMPSNEILRMLGCRHEYEPGRGHLVTVRDGDCRTTVEGVFGVGGLLRARRGAGGGGRGRRRRARRGGGCWVTKRRRGS